MEVTETVLNIYSALKSRKGTAMGSFMCVTQNQSLMHMTASDLMHNLSFREYETWKTRLMVRIGRSKIWKRR